MRNLDYMVKTGLATRVRNPDCLRGRFLKKSGDSENSGRIRANFELVTFPKERQISHNCRWAETAAHHTVSLEFAADITAVTRIESSEMIFTVSSKRWEMSN